MRGKPYAYRFLSAADKKECCDTLISYAGCKSDKIEEKVFSGRNPMHGVPSSMSQGRKKPSPLDAHTKVREVHNRHTTPHRICFSISASHRIALAFPSLHHTTLAFPQLWAFSLYCLHKLLYSFCWSNCFISNHCWIIIGGWPLLEGILLNNSTSSCMCLHITRVSSWCVFGGTVQEPRVLCDSNRSFNEHEQEVADQRGEEGAHSEGR